MHPPLQKMLTFRCSNLAGCTAGFPLTKYTKMKLVTCPVEGCGQETNIWKKLQKIQDIKDLHKNLLLGKNCTMLQETISTLNCVIREWGNIAEWPYEDVSTACKDLRVAILLQHFDKEEEWRMEYY